MSIRFWNTIQKSGVFVHNNMQPLGQKIHEQENSLRRANGECIARVNLFVEESAAQIAIDPTNNHPDPAHPRKYGVASAASHRVALPQNVPHN